MLANSGSAAPVSAAPAKITFTLKSSPARPYVLHVALLIESPSVPVLRVGINGKHGMFYLHPVLDLHGGDERDVVIPYYSHADVYFRFSGNYLHKGTNTISLEAIEEASEEVPNAGFNYDAISLCRADAPAAGPASRAMILPTVFYEQKQSELSEMVAVFIRFDGRPENGSKVNLAVAGKRYSESVTANEDFGEEKFEFFVPEFVPHSQPSFPGIASIIGVI